MTNRAANTPPMTTLTIGKASASPTTPNSSSKFASKQSTLKRTIRYKYEYIFLLGDRRNKKLLNKESVITHHRWKFQKLQSKTESKNERVLALPPTLKKIKRK